MSVLVEAMATGWLKGTVKAVSSGDSLLVMGSVKGGPPPEKTITLAGLIAPKLVRAHLGCGLVDWFVVRSGSVHWLESKCGLMLCRGGRS